ncbi:hypothetical protein [Streptomyces sp. NPDC097619]|uniref:hypothetical protein n=1 Tax=Streptomyces sp. NPDC097619 TaxID=3157228 RepID=UPI00332E42D2
MAGLLPKVAVVAPLTGPRAAWGAVLLGRLEALRATRPEVADWRVHDETRGEVADVSGGGYAAVVGHADPAGAERAVPRYAAAGLPCLLPFVRPGAGAEGLAGVLSWAPDGAGAARAAVEAAAGLGARRVRILHDAEPPWQGPAREVAERAAAAGLVPVPVPAPGGGAPAGAGEGDGEDGGTVSVVLAAPHRCPELARAAGGRGPVLVPGESGLGTVPFGAGTGAGAGAGAGLDLWFVRPHACAATRAHRALEALFRGLERGVERGAGPRGAELVAAVRGEAGVVWGAGGVPVGAGWEVVRG